MNSKRTQDVGLRTPKRGLSAEDLGLTSTGLSAEDLGLGVALASH